MNSPPSSPPPPDTPESSPPSSPLISPRKPAKRARWQVFGFRDGASQPCQRTLLRWQDRGLLPSVTFEQEDGADKPNDEGGEQLNNEVTNQVNCGSDSVLGDSDSVLGDSDSVLDSSHSEAPLDTSTSDNFNDSDIADNRFYDSDEEVFYKEGSSDEENDDHIPLYPESKYSRDEAILDLLDDYFNNRESQKSLKDHLATFVKYLPKNNSMPKSVYLLFSNLKKLAPSYMFYPKFYCSKCLIYLVDNNEVCSSCAEATHNEFYMFDLAEQVRFYFEHYQLAELIDGYSGVFQVDDKITDICHGSEYKRLKVDGRYNLTLAWNTDGVSLSKSSHCHLYPVLATISELPSRVRSRFIIVAGVWCDKVAPPMNTLLRPFCEAIVAINAKGGVSWKNSQSGEQFKCIVSAPLCIADAPVRAQIQNIKSHTSKHGCNTCEQKTESIPLTAAQRAAKAAGNKKIKKRRGYIFADPGARLRTGSRMLKQARKAFFERNSVKGVKGPSVVSKIPHLDLGTCVIAEYMHGTCLGACRYITNILINKPGGPWYIGDKLDQIDTNLESIKPCDYICRLPRKLSELFKWKASELRVWLLFYSVLILPKFLAPIYAQHWILFVNAIWLLLQDEITDIDLQKSEEMLNLFVKDFGRLYGQSCLVYNIHQLLHLPLYVRRWGPLWATSAFVFESYNKTIGELIHGTKNRAKELVNLLHISHGVQILRERVERRVNIRDSIDLSRECKLSVLSDVEKAFLVSSGVSSPFKVFARVTVRKEQFTSLLCKETKRINFCVGFEKEGRKQFGDIKLFITFDGSVELALVKCFKVDHRRVILHESTRAVLKHIIPVILSDTFALVPVNCLFKVLKFDSYIGLMPNMYEKSL